MLGRLIPEKQILNDQLKQVQQNSLHSRCCLSFCLSLTGISSLERILKTGFPHCQLVF